MDATPRKRDDAAAAVPEARVRRLVALSMAELPSTVPTGEVDVSLAVIVSSCFGWVKLVWRRRVGLFLELLVLEGTYAGRPFTVICQRHWTT
jgi:hypothetical protein